MKSVVLYYSFSGNTKKIAEKLSTENGADICSVTEKKKRSVLNAYTSGAVQARKQKRTEINEISVDLSAYERLYICAPVWFGFPAPAFNSVIDMLPAGKDVEIVMVSGSGSSKGSAEKTKKLVENKGSKVVSYTDIKA